jgi:hypothetical protein
MFLGLKKPSLQIYGQTHIGMRLWLAIWLELQSKPLSPRRGKIRVAPAWRRRCSRRLADIAFWLRQVPFFITALSSVTLTQIVPGFRTVLSQEVFLFLGCF